MVFYLLHRRRRRRRRRQKRSNCRRCCLGDGIVSTPLEMDEYRKMDSWWKNGGSSRSHHTKPSPFQNGCLSKMFSSNHPDASAAGVVFKYVPQTAGTTFALSSVLFFFYDLLVCSFWFSGFFKRDCPIGSGSKQVSGPRENFKIQRSKNSENKGIWYDSYLLELDNLGCCRHTATLPVNQGVGYQQVWPGLPAVSKWPSSCGSLPLGGLFFSAQRSSCPGGSW